MLLWVYNPPLSMNFDQYKGNKRGGTEQEEGGARDGGRERERERERERDTVSVTSTAPLGSQAAEFEKLLP